MPPRPHYEVYQTQMLKKLHGFPQFNADPEGNTSLRATDEVGKIEIGDVGYFREGRFARIFSLDLPAICGPGLDFSTESIPMDSPECAGNINMIELNTGLSATAGALPGIPLLGGGPNIRLKCIKGEGAILNVQSGKATYTYCDTTSKILLGEHMLKNYKQWRSDLRNARYIEPEELFLVTGTYMTRNWEAATFRKDTNTSIGFDVTVDAVLIEGKMSIDWKTWRNGERGFRLGHTHTDHIYPRHNTVPSFGACCNTCLEPPENQCIFLRGWRIKEPALVKSRLAYFASVESTEKEELRIKRGLSLFGGLNLSNSTNPVRSRSQDKLSRSDDTCPESDEHPVATLVEAEGTPVSGVGCADIDLYDLVANTKFRHLPVAQEAVLLHDDEVIEFCSDDLDIARFLVFEKSQVNPDSPVTHTDLLKPKSEFKPELLRKRLEHQPIIKNKEKEKTSTGTTPAQLLSSSPFTGAESPMDIGEEPIRPMYGQRSDTSPSSTVVTEPHPVSRPGGSSKVADRSQRSHGSIHPTAAVRLEKLDERIAKTDQALDKFFKEMLMGKRSTSDIVSPSREDAEDTDSVSERKPAASSIGEAGLESFQYPQYTQPGPGSLVHDQTRTGDHARMSGEYENLEDNH